MFQVDYFEDHLRRNWMEDTKQSFKSSAGIGGKEHMAP